MSEKIKLTQFSHGGGCGCKIAPGVLEEMLRSDLTFSPSDKLLVGNASKDDAAVYDIGNGKAVISTTDFFMPIVDDAFDFGRIASANAISDIYAMGGTPLLAIAILGWPVNKIPADVARQVLEGSRTICARAGIPLAGGHSIDSPEPIFGLAVTGTVQILHLKRNNTAQEGDLIFLTKPLGVGIMSTAQKRGLLSSEHLYELVKQLTQLNSAGEAFGKLAGVTAMTDVTGFGLAGHLLEMAEGSNLTAEIIYSDIPVHPNVQEYLLQKAIPGATARNWQNVVDEIGFEGNIDITEASLLMPDPQTNGGLLIAVKPHSVQEFRTILKQFDIIYTEPIGRFIARKEKLILIK